MHTRDLSNPCPSVSEDDDTQIALRQVTEHQLPTLLVRESDGLPYAVVHTLRHIGRLLPGLVRADPLLRSAVGERLDADVRRTTVDTNIAAWLPRARVRPPAVRPSSTTRELAALMDRHQSPLVAVIERDANGPRWLGMVTANRLLEHFIGES